MSEEELEKLGIRMQKAFSSPGQIIGPVVLQYDAAERIYNQLKALTTENKRLRVDFDAEFDAGYKQAWDECIKHFEDGFDELLNTAKKPRALKRKG
jgi:hypothetical protein